MNSHGHPQSPSQVSDRASAQALFKDVFAGPELFLSSLDVTGNTMSFTPMSLETYRSSDFLDHRMHRTAGSDITLDSNTFVALFDRFNPEQKPLSFIFHTGYCCSTLLARCLENLNHTLVWKMKFSGFCSGLIRSNRSRTVPIVLGPQPQHYALYTHEP